MNKLAALFLLGLSFNTTFAQTTIAAGDEVSGTWTTKGSPYIVEGEAIVPEGKTLTIQAGVEVHFKGGYAEDYIWEDGEYNLDFDRGFLRVNGKLVAQGSKKKMVKFMLDPNAEEGARWGGIVFEFSKEENLLKYCQISNTHYIRYVSIDDNATGAVTFIDSKGTLEYCVISNSWSGVNCKQGSSPTLNHVTLAANEYGLETNTESSPDVTNSIIYGNGENFYVNGDSEPSFSHCLIGDKRVPEGADNVGDNLFKKNPEFTNADEGDFSISKKSPARKAGSDKKNMGAL
jgi:hypothetical protein